MDECCVCGLPSSDGFDHDQCTDPAWWDHEEDRMTEAEKAAAYDELVAAMPISEADRRLSLCPDCLFFDDHDHGCENITAEPEEVAR